MYLNEFDATMKHIQGKWKIMIMYELYERKVARFNELQRYIASISPKTLTNQLKEMEKDGLIKRVVYPVVPPHVEYSLTPKGDSLIPVLNVIFNWGLSVIPSDQLQRTLCDE